MALVPTMIPHNLRNVGQETAKVLGFFGSPNIVATFDEVWLPSKSRVVDTADMSEPAAQQKQNTLSNRPVADKQILCQDRLMGIQSKNHKGE